MTVIHQEENKSCNMVAPAGLSEDKEVLFPVSDAQAPEETSGTLAVTVKQMVTLLHLADALTGAMTINLTIDEQVTPGAILHLKAASDTTARDITFGTGFSAPVLAGVISTTRVQSFIYDGTSFIPMGAAMSID